MIRRFLAAVLATAVYLCVPTVAAVAQPSAALAQKALDAGELTAIAGQRGHVRVIVEFALPGGPLRLTPDPAALAPVRAQVAAMQDAILTSHFGTAAPSAGPGFDRALRKLEISPMFAMNVSRAELEALAVDPRVVRIYHDRPEPASLATSVPIVGLPTSGGPYDLGATGAGQAIAILDTGVDKSHAFITANKVIAEACFSTNDPSQNSISFCPNGQQTQIGSGAGVNCPWPGITPCFHGTHVAGIAAGNNTNPGAGAPPNGVAKDAKIIAVQVFSNTSTGPLSFPLDVVAALDWLFQNLNTLPGGAKLAAVNMSLGGGNNASACDSDPRAAMIANMRAAGVAVVVSSGNQGLTNGVNAPGCISAALAVGSTDKSNVISCFSNMSPQVGLLAPGGFLGGFSGSGSPPCAGGISAGDINSSFPANTYSAISGTSMAAPHVAGAFAVLRSVFRNATVSDIENALKNTGNPISDNRPGGTQTKPLIRVDLALQSLASSQQDEIVVLPASDQITYVFGPQGGPFTPASFSFTVKAKTSLAQFSVENVPSWLTASHTTAYVSTAGTTVTFTVNANANAFTVGSYLSELRIRNLSNNNAGLATRSVRLNVGVPRPANDDFANAATLALGATVSVDATAGTRQIGEPGHCPLDPESCGEAGRSVWWKFTSPISGEVIVSTRNGTFYHFLAVYNGNAVNALTRIGSEWSVITPLQSGDESAATLRFEAIAGTTYAISVDGLEAFQEPGPNRAETALLTVVGGLAVSPVTSTIMNGPPGGPFSPNTLSYTLQNASVAPIDFNVGFGNCGDAFVPSDSSGTLAAGESKVVTFAPSSVIDTLAPGIHAYECLFQNTAGSGLGNTRRTLYVVVNAGGAAAQIFAAVAPNARTTRIGTTVTGFGTIINASSNNATACSIALPSGVAATFLYQTTNPATNEPSGTPNTPVDIASGKFQSYYFAITPTQAFSQDIPLIFDCTNTNPAPVFTGLNTFLVTANNTGISDMLSIADTLTHDGIMIIPGVNGTGLTVTAAVNIAAAGTVTFKPSDSPIGQALRNLPLDLLICQTNPATGACINPTSPGNSATLNVAANETVFFSIFAVGKGIPIPFDPANNRVFIIGLQGSTAVGAASTAVKTD